VTTYVLVHGAWGGAHGWRKVRPLLQKAGHEVFTPSLTGLGERAHLTSPQVTLTTHIQDIVNCIEYEDLKPIVLLGYSYGGMVITGAIDYVEERVSHLVYLDAFLPDDGQSLYGLTRKQPRAMPGQDWLVPPPAREYDDPEEAAWANPRRIPQPRGCFTEPVRLLRPLEERAFSRTYIKATGEPRPPEGGPFWRAADRTRENPAWRYREIATNHMIPNNRPEELASLLLELAS
jgi:pimeloyl-ACP methyl ester carboxylesterase